MWLQETVRDIKLNLIFLTNDIIKRMQKIEFLGKWQSGRFSLEFLTDIIFAHFLYERQNHWK